MPFQNGEREKLSSQYKNLIDFYFLKVKPIVTGAERMDPEQRMVITAAIEIRSAFDHIMRVDGFIEGSVSESTVAESQLTVFEYCKKNLDKAHGHLYRAAYDAYDIIAFSLTETIEKALPKISQEALYTVISDAANKIINPFYKALEIVTQAKVKKDVDGRDAEEVEFKMYEQAATDLLTIRDIIDNNMHALILYDKELKKKKFWNAFFAWGGWVAAIVSIMVAIYFGFKTLHP
jgi:hypothetical protein